MKNKIRAVLSVEATPVAHEFIDRYMVSANGEYVKVYLYVLRHNKEELKVSEIADALNSTESDVQRALAYWEKAGILNWQQEQQREEKAILESGKQEQRTKAGGQTSCTSTVSKKDRGAGSEEEFSQFLYVVQQYLGKIITPSDCQRLSYLYEELQMSVDLLEYLVESCAEAGHREIRYIEKVGLNWHKEGIRTVEQAQGKKIFSSDLFAVLKAFGISDRNPAASEEKYAKKWFRTFGFSREVVLEACSRTINTIHKPSFPYADKILSDWHEAGVKRLADVELVEKERKKPENSEKEAPRKYGASKGNNRFHNFEQSNYDYDAMVWNMIKEQS